MRWLVLLLLLAGCWPQSSEYGALLVRLNKESAQRDLKYQASYKLDFENYNRGKEGFLMFRGYGGAWAGKWSVPEEILSEMRRDLDNPYIYPGTWHASNVPVHEIVNVKLYARGAGKKSWVLCASYYENFRRYYTNVWKIDTRACFEEHDKYWNYRIEEEGWPDER